MHFLTTEWEQVVDAWQLKSWEPYRDVVRLGSKTRLKEPQRAIGNLREGPRFTRESWATYSDVFSLMAAKLQGGANPPFDCVVVDEAQDVSVGPSSANSTWLIALGSHSEAYRGKDGHVLSPPQHTVTLEREERSGIGGRLGTQKLKNFLDSIVFT